MQKTEGSKTTKAGWPIYKQEKNNWYDGMSINNVVFFQPFWLSGAVPCYIILTCKFYALFTENCQKDSTVNRQHSLLEPTMDWI